MDTKKKTIVPTERDRESVMAARERFCSQIASIPRHRLVFLDETGSHIAMTRASAWAPLGQRAVGRIPRNRGTVTTVIGAIARRGLTAMMTVVGGTSGEVFLRFVHQHLCPRLRRGDVVVMDNLGAHHATGVRAAIESAGASVLYMPPYSPDLNPIELCWSKFKDILRELGARTRSRLEDAIAVAATSITRSDARGWFRHCGY